MALILLIIVSIAFAATHIGLETEHYKANLVKRFGDKGFKGIYLLVSLITFGGAIYFFAKARVAGMGAGPLLWSAPGLREIAPLVLMLFAVPMVILGFAQPSPTGAVQISFEPRAIHKITRHPVNMGIALFALAHLIPNGYLGDIFFFGSLFVVGFFGAYHQDIRKTKEVGEKFIEFKKKTSVFPFAAIVTRKAKLKLAEVSVPLLVVSLVVYLALLILHSRFFGVSAL